MGGFDAAYLASPADASKVKYGASEIRAAKLNDQEVLAIDHYVTTGTNLTKHGQHKKITFNDVLAVGPGLAGDESAIYPKTGSMNIVPYFKEGSNEHRIVIGDSNMIAWFYTNVAPIGWTVTTDGADKVLGVAGGSGQYAVNGGTTAGTYEAAHVHPSPTHTHPTGTHIHDAGTLRFKVFDRKANQILYGQTLYGAEEFVFRVVNAGFSGSGQRYPYLFNGLDLAKVYFTYTGGYGNTGPSSGSTTATAAVINHNTNAALRPAAAIGRLFELDI